MAASREACRCRLCAEASGTAPTEHRSPSWPLPCRACRHANGFRWIHEDRSGQRDALRRSRADASLRAARTSADLSALSSRPASRGLEGRHFLRALHRRDARLRHGARVRSRSRPRDYGDPIAGVALVVTCIVIDHLSKPSRRLITAIRPRCIMRSAPPSLRSQSPWWCFPESLVWPR